ncbi:MAG: Lipoprotein-releasing system ATP-binding protein LolD [Chlamydiales bacterium]|nr:Lipoprotein-releasing system ATP-binding protein LolD [Chlamydiales bacterium]MCH9620176.1 Lipoprotein-releasing system ATP-binding protein LolD [Chlamydiales bacterium]MCH9623109.1 Lipoprotein-releasing system ATP-binding protein LolD [Chlamydiales bacterium]
MMTTILAAKKLHKSFLRPKKIDILDEVSLKLKTGESIAIMGASGEGKTTLLQILGTLDNATSGSLEIVGQRVTGKNAPNLRNQHIGFVFQSCNLLADYTALHNVLMPALIAGEDISKGSKSYFRALELLKHVGLEDRIHFPSKLLSGGEKQRVSIARALCNDPQIILADEPSGNLDHSTSTHIHALLLQCAQQFNKGLIVVTHDQELASLCQSTMILKEGNLTT